VLYSLLQIVMIGGLDPRNIVKGWTQPLGTDPSDYGAWYTLALAVGAGWLAKVLIIDAVISPAGTGVVYVATTARISYALGEEQEMPTVLATTNRKGVPVVSILVASVVGCLALGPFKSWRAQTVAQNTVRNAVWILPWLGGQVLIGLLGRYGNSASNLLPNRVDIFVVIAFALAIFYWAVHIGLSTEAAQAAVEKDAPQIG